MTPTNRKRIHSIAQPLQMEQLKDRIVPATNVLHGSGTCPCFMCCSSHDEHDLMVAENGRMFYADTHLALESRIAAATEAGDQDFLNSISATGASAFAPAFPTTDTFKLHSRASATKKIYLDFNGHIDEQFTWGSPQIKMTAFDIDGKNTQFSTTEHEIMQNVFLRVAADFQPFDVDVTTEEPPVEDLMNTSNGDDRWGIRVAIGVAPVEFVPGAGGVAFLSSFSDSTDTPTWVFTDRLANDAKFIADAASHEVGHTLGLAHDGTAALGYYPGHGTGATSWAPIMGVAYDVELGHWSRATYPGANNIQDDLLAITTQNGFGFIADEYSNDYTTANFVPVADLGGGIGKIDFKSLIHERNDFDWIAFTADPGLASFTFTSLGLGANLDIWAGLYDAGGNLLQFNNPTGGINAAISFNIANTGTYLLKVDGVGRDAIPGNPGYKDYGSIGEYQLTGTFTQAARFDLVIDGDQDFFGQGDDIMISRRENDLGIVVTRNGTEVGVYDGNLVNKIVVNGQAGDDYLHFDSTFGVPDPINGIFLNGNDGNDLIDISNTSRSMTLDGGNDQDFLIGSDQVDTIFGSDGDDTLQSGLSDDVVDGGNGDDQLYEVGDTDWTVDDNEVVNDIQGSQFILGSNIEGVHLVAETGSANNLMDASLFSGKSTLVGGDGNDSLAGAKGGSLLDGGKGNDFLVGNIGNDELLLGTDNDTVDLTVGDDTIVDIGGEDVLNIVSDNDLILTDTTFETVGLGLTTLTSGSIEHIAVLGGASNNMIDASGMTLGVFIDADAGDDTVLGGSGSDTISGFDGNDSLLGNDGDDTLDAGAGNDTANGGNDADFISLGNDNDIGVGSEGHDTVNGDAGNDLLVGNAGTDVMDGGTGNDTLTGGSGNDVLAGGDGVDIVTWYGDGSVTFTNTFVNAGGFGKFSLTDVEKFAIYGGAGNGYYDASTTKLGVYADGDAGNDTIFGGSASDLLRGGDGNDSITGGLGNDGIYGDAGNDTGSGGAGIDFVNGGDDNDVLNGDNDIDTVLGGLGNDTVIASLGFDYLEGGAGLDVLALAAINNLVLSNNLAAFDGTQNRHSQFEGAEITGTIGNDRMNFASFTGNAKVSTGAGNDSVFGGSGNDRIDVGADDDVVNAGFGDDTIFGQAGNDNIRLDGGNDYVNAGTGNDTVVAGDGNDIVLLGSGDDLADLGTGNDWLDAGAGNDRAVGQSGDDTMLGGDGNDTLQGDDGNDLLRGELNNDVLVGNAGDDTLDGGADIDIASDNLGNNIFLFIP